MAPDERMYSQKSAAALPYEESRSCSSSVSAVASDLARRSATRLGSAARASAGLGARPLEGEPFAIEGSRLLAPCPCCIPCRPAGQQRRPQEPRRACRPVCAKGETAALTPRLNTNIKR